MAACAGTHFWAGERAKLGHDLRLMPPSCGKPYVKRGKTEAADAGAIAEAASRPSMRFVSVKTAAQQAILTRRRSRDVLARPLTQWDDCDPRGLGRVRKRGCEGGGLPPLGGPDQI
jgi:transposase